MPAAERKAKIAAAEALLRAAADAAFVLLVAASLAFIATSAVVRLAKVPPTADALAQSIVTVPEPPLPRPRPKRKLPVKSARGDAITAVDANAGLLTGILKTFRIDLPTDARN
jgi:hypothetical protein